MFPSKTVGLHVKWNENVNTREGSWFCVSAIEEGWREKQRQRSSRLFGGQTLCKPLWRQEIQQIWPPPPPKQTQRPLPWLLSLHPSSMLWNAGTQERKPWNATKIFLGTQNWKAKPEKKEKDHPFKVKIFFLWRVSPVHHQYKYLLV